MLFLRVVVGRLKDLTSCASRTNRIPPILEVPTSQMLGNHGKVGLLHVGIVKHVHHKAREAEEAHIAFDPVRMDVCTCTTSQMRSSGYRLSTNTGKLMRRNMIENDRLMIRIVCCKASRKALSILWLRYCMFDLSVPDEPNVPSAHRLPQLSCSWSRRD